MTKVLVVDDEPSLVRTLSINLRARDYQVEHAFDGRSALQSIAEDCPDVIVLDLGLPDIDGVEVIRRVRATSEVPIIVLSARHDSDDKVEALDCGADDYVTKPFGMDELLARVRAAVRRHTPATSHAPAIHTPDFALDFAERIAIRDGVQVRLTPTEWHFLEALAVQPGHLVTQADLLREVWGAGYEKETHYLRVYAGGLRRKLEPDPAHPRYLVTDPGIGYRLLTGTTERRPQH
ncbi:response regulator [Rudaeicoccus suwonensis]|uniref:Two-component system KDP operon response regulator KdpE n=1 Tax=Rudaeicoccus suwonensis TaxID=657409 RepID=A0A561ECL5_9MICO|nr:response regulator transcription factor [Rudaeicoccus suwonensis]TWE13358.1 two-component system KDP operon response regulator KdpE [Rudaeicoccus suwonensis]